MSLITNDMLMLLYREPDYHINYDYEIEIINITNYIITTAPVNYHGCYFIPKKHVNFDFTNKKYIRNLFTLPTEYDKKYEL